MGKNRKTKGREDLAYCLMGIFGVNMPLLYGEGDKAFQRLQLEILKDTTDFTILAHESESNSPSSLLAPHPRCFLPNLNAIGQDSLPPIRSSSQNITFEGFLCPVGTATEPQYHGAVLDCHFGQDVFARAILIPECVNSSKIIFVRANYQRVYRIEEHNRLAPHDIFGLGM